MEKSQIVIAAAACLLVSCDKNQDKFSEATSIVSCMQRQHTNDDYTLVTKCVPLAPPEHFRGTWIVGFEVSEFRPRAGEISEKKYQLVVPRKIGHLAHSADSMGQRAFDVSFVGRQSQKPVSDHQYVVVVDQLVSAARVVTDAGDYPRDS
jgi:hypothetical protein